MARELLIVDGVSDDVKKALQESAKARFGQANASLMVRELIAQHLQKYASNIRPGTPHEDVRDRVEIRMPRLALKAVDERAENVFSTRNNYIVGLVMADLGIPQLAPAEVEVLRRSNYELSKLGTNLNQIARAMNTLVAMGGGQKLPETGKKIASLRKEIKEHTNKVLTVLRAGSHIVDAQNRGKNKLSQMKRKDS